MPQLTPEIINLGSTAVVSIVALWAIVEVVKSKRNYRKNQKNNNKFLKELRDNHLVAMSTKIDGLVDCAERLTDRQERMIELLVEIKTLLQGDD